MEEPTTLELLQRVEHTQAALRKLAGDASLIEMHLSTLQGKLIDKLAMENMKENNK